MNHTSDHSNGGVILSSALLQPEAFDDLTAAAPTTTTVFLIVFIHVLFFHQWNARRRRKDMLVSYYVIVQKRQYHKLWMALLSHPPAGNHHPTVFRQQQSNESEEGGATNMNNAMNNPTFSSFWLQPHQELRTFVSSTVRQAASWSYQSGFALLLYNSHVLWSCRALEGWYNLGQFITPTTNDVNLINNNPQQQQPINISSTITTQPLQYARALMALAAISVLVELRFSYTLLRISKRLAASGMADSNNNSMIIPLYHDDNPSNGSSSTTGTTNRVQQKILRRPIGTLTALSCALITVFSHHFEYVPLQVLPFVDNRVLLLGWSLSATLSSFLCWGILGYLSYPSHPITPVMCGLVSGVLWSFGVTSFLQDAYWGGSLAVVLFILCCLSLRASDNRSREAMELRGSSSWIPCVDYVSWNHRGESVRGSSAYEARPHHPYHAQHHAVVNSSEEDDSSSNTSSDDASIYSLTDTMMMRPASSDNNHNNRGRIDDDDDSDGGVNTMEDIPLLMDSRNQQQPLRSRRGTPSG